MQTKEYLHNFFRLEFYKSKRVERHKNIFKWYIISDIIISYYEAVVEKSKSKEK